MGASIIWTPLSGFQTSFKGKVSVKEFLRFNRYVIKSSEVAELVGFLSETPPTLLYNFMDTLSQRNQKQWKNKKLPLTYTVLMSLAVLHF